jgi:hypothetical protein
MNFIALGVIAEIDNIYAGSLVSDPIKKSIDGREPLLVRRDMNAGSGFFIGALKVCYQSYYYYYMPLTVVIIVCLNSL